MKINNKGQALVEYILIITLITSVTAVAILFLGSAIRNSISKVACQITGGTYDKTTNKCDTNLDLE